MCVSHTRKRETRVLGARLTLGPDTIKFQAPRSLVPHLAIFETAKCSRSSVTLDTAAPPPHAVLNPVPIARCCLVLGLGARRRLDLALKRATASSPTRSMPPPRPWPRSMSPPHPQPGAHRCGPQACCLLSSSPENAATSLR
jgi:hypothetical protein